MVALGSRSVWGASGSRAVSRPGVVAVLVLALAGCASYDGSTLIAGKSTAADVESLMGQADEGRPVIIVRGLRWPGTQSSSAELVRPASEDLFR